MDNTFLDVNQTSSYLNVKRSFIYSLVEAEEIPHYRLGRLIRFRKTDLEEWMENHRCATSTAESKPRSILKATDRGILDVGSMVKKSIDEVKGKCYPADSGKTDQIKAQRKGEEDVTLS